MKKLYSLLIFLFLLFTISCDEEAALAAEECLQDIDCAGECGGSAVVDNCDVCDADASNDCTLDDCNVWGGDSTSCSPVTFNFTGDVDTFDADEFENSLAIMLTCNVSQVDVVDFGYVSNTRSGEMYVIVNFLESDESSASVDDLLQTVQTEFANGGSVGDYNVSAPVIANISEDACQSTLDECGVCGGSGIPQGECDCFGNVNDCNGDCGGTAVEDCNGDCGGSAVVDACGDCGGDAESLDDCPICYNGSINAGIIGYWDGATYSNEGSCDEEDGGHYDNIIEWNLEFYEEGNEVLYAVQFRNGGKGYEGDSMTDGDLSEEVSPVYEMGTLSCSDNDGNGSIDEEYLTFCPDYHTENADGSSDEADCFVAMIELNDGNLTMVQNHSEEGVECTETITFTQSEPSMCDDDMIDSAIIGDWLGYTYSASSGCNPDEIMTQDEIMQWWLQVEYDDGDYTFDAEQHEYECDEEELLDEDDEDSCHYNEEGVFSCADIGNDVQMCFEEEMYLNGMYDSHLTDCQNVSLSVDLTTLTISNTYLSYAENDTDYDICTETLTFVRPYTLDCISDCDQTQLLTFQNFVEDWDEDEISDEEAYNFCNWFLDQDDNGCLGDCGVNQYLDQMMDMCEEAIGDYGASCDDDEFDCFEDLDMDDYSYPDCISDCEGVDGLMDIEDPDAFCNVITGFSQDCISDCVFNGYNSIEALQQDCSTCTQDDCGCEGLLYEDHLGCDGCGEYSDDPNACEESDLCGWDDENNTCVEEDDGAPECVQDCPGINDIDNEDIGSVCAWVASNGGSSNACFDDCSDEEMEFPIMLDSLCSCYALGEDECATSNDCSFGNWDEDTGCWPNFVFEEDDYNWACDDGDGTYWYSDEDECNENCNTECQYDDNDNGNSSIEECFEGMDMNVEFMCAVISDEDACEFSDSCYWENDAEVPYCSIDGPPSCIWDCEGVCQFVGENDNSVLDFCQWVTGIENDGCSSDCSDEWLGQLSQFTTECQACIDTNDETSDACNEVDYGGDDDCDDCHSECDDDDTSCHDNCDDNYCDDNENWYCDYLDGNTDWYESEEECQSNCDTTCQYSEDECEDCMDYCVSYVMENYSYTQDQANEWCLTMPNSQFGCADTCDWQDEDEESTPAEDNTIEYQYFCDEQGVETYYDSLDECEENCTDGCWMTESSDSSDDDGPPECLNDCSGYEQLVACADGSCGWDTYCTYISSWNGDDCSSDCQGEDVEILSVMGPVCEQCLAAENCEEMFGSDGNGDMDMDIEVPECAMSCVFELALLGDMSGGESEDVNFTDAQCQWIEAQSTDQACSNDCNEQDQATWSTYLTLIYAFSCATDSSGE